jgi:hypothetical protein
MSNYIKEIKMYRIFYCVAGLLVLMALSCLILQFLNNPAISATAHGSSAGVRDQREVDDRRLLSTHLSVAFDASLEMKENVDFLLTPALLVQEAISEDIVITYPSE